MKPLFRSPFSGQYWRESAAVLRSVRILTVSAALLALGAVLQAYFCIPLVIFGTEQKITATFLVMSVSSMIFGPLVAIPAGFILDTVAFLLRPDGTYMFWFAFVIVLKYLIYALFFFRQKITFRRVAVSHVLTTFLCNIILNSTLIYLFFSSRSTAYWIYLLARIPKNLILVIPELILIWLFMKAICPALARMKLIPAEQGQVRLLRKKQ